MARYVYSFGDDLGSPNPKNILGGKGAGLAEMTRMGIPVPPGFTITTEACNAWRASKGTHVDSLDTQVASAVKQVEERLGRRLGDAKNPLLVSVRSGARASMPGMMDTILNLGLNDETVEGLARVSDNRRFAFDSYRRFVEMYSSVVLEVDREHYEHAITELKKKLGKPTMSDSEVPAADLETLVKRFKAITLAEAGKPFPTDVKEQLWGAVAAVFRSWDNPRAIRYRRMHNLPDHWGTAVNVQAMVFGNLGDDSGSGVAFTRNPANGEKLLYGEFLPNAQGEDVVAGIRTPRSLSVAAAPGKEAETLERTMPAAYKEIAGLATKLETHFKDMQDIEFTIERSKVYLLQTRNGKRTAHAAVKVAVDMVKEGLHKDEEALLKVDPEQLEQLLHPSLPHPDVLAGKGIKPIASGLPASPGAATGAIVLNADEAEKEATAGKAVILVRRETSPEDIHGMKAARGILTATGGMTSHAAVVARGLGTCCVAGSSALQVDYKAGTITVVQGPGATPITLKVGDVITIDGTHGKIYRGALEVDATAKIAEFDQFMGWADKHRRMRVRTNSDTPEQSKQAIGFGAEGIGLCRTEHMFFADDRLEAVRCMALSDTEENRAKWLATIEPMQRGDFEGIFTAMNGFPVTIRLLDWPLHEFMPKETRDFASVAKALGVAVDVVHRRAESLHELNPMLGHRGVRVGIIHASVYEMQIRAIIDAALACQRRGVKVLPEIMVPVLCLATELAAMREIVDRVAGERIKTAGAKLEYQVGTMIELPRACLVAGELAKIGEFFSFGTNDLTQTTFGISRDDAGRFLPEYVNRGLLEADPFARLDTTGVGELVRIACERGRAARPKLKLGVCGEHGGDPSSIAFCEEVGLDYVSCSPPRLPVARLAAAQAAIQRGKGTRSSQTA